MLSWSGWCVFVPEVACDDNQVEYVYGVRTYQVHGRVGGVEEAGFPGKVAYVNFSVVVQVSSYRRVCIGKVRA